MQSSTKEWKEQYNHFMFIFYYHFNFFLKCETEIKIEVTAYFSKQNYSHLQLWKHYEVQTMKPSPVVEIQTSFRRLDFRNLQQQACPFPFVPCQQHLFCHIICHKIPDRNSVVFHWVLIHPSQFQNNISWIKTRTEVADPQVCYSLASRSTRIHNSMVAFLGFGKS